MIIKGNLKIIKDPIALAKENNYFHEIKAVTC